MQCIVGHEDVEAGVVGTPVGDRRRATQDARGSGEVLERGKCAHGGVIGEEIRLWRRRPRGGHPGGGRRRRAQWPSGRSGAAGENLGVVALVIAALPHRERRVAGAHLVLVARLMIMRSAEGAASTTVANTVQRACGDAFSFVVQTFKRSNFKASKLHRHRPPLVRVNSCSNTCHVLNNTSSTSTICSAFRDRLRHVQPPDPGLSFERVRHRNRTCTYF